MALRHLPPGVGLPALLPPPPPLPVNAPLDDAGPLLAAPTRASKQPYLCTPSLQFYRLYTFKLRMAWLNEST
jgi:hypothetical protein